LSAEEQQKILDARARTNLRADAACGADGEASRDDGKVLKRHGVSRRRRGERQSYRRFEWSQPGALLHIDAYKAPKFLAPGHRVTAVRDQRQAFAAWFTAW
jgi:hypothetical protein